MKRNDYIVILAPMVTELGLQGNALLVFAMIHGFSKDGSHKYQGSFQYIADWLNISIRSAKEIVANLIADGYLNKTQEMGPNGHIINVYSSNYDDLLSRVAAGEELRPTKLKSRRSSKKDNGAQCAPIFTTDANGAQNAPLTVHTPAKIGAQCAPNKYIKYINNLSSQALARKEEETYFYNIFFLRNAADPAAEVRRFVGWYQSHEWKSKDGIAYITTQQRCGLAYAWEIKQKERIPACEMTDTFYAFLEDVYEQADQLGGIDPAIIFDSKTRFEVEDGSTILVYCKREFSRWGSEHLRTMSLAKAATFGNDFEIAPRAWKTNSSHHQATASL